MSASWSGLQHCRSVAPKGVVVLLGLCICGQQELHSHKVLFQQEHFPSPRQQCGSEALSQTQGYPCAAAVPEALAQSAVRTPFSLGKTDLQSTCSQTSCSDSSCQLGYTQKPDEVKVLHADSITAPRCK